MRGLQWIFDPVPPSGALSGGDTSSYVFKPSIDTFVREVVQNSNDQRSGLDPVDVVFRLFEFTNSEAANVALSTIGWAGLSEHLEAVAHSDSLIAGRVADALRAAAEGRLLLLTVTDTNTRGLFGGELARDGNFAPLCRHKLVTSDDKALGGGSHGLGKAVLWSFSSISTVAFSSMIQEHLGELRFIARAELPYHDCDDATFAGSGWFGEPRDDGHGPYAASAWFNEDNHEFAGSPIERPFDVTGTSILIPFFFEPQEDSDRSTIEIATSIGDSVVKWFWPSMNVSQLRVKVEAFQNGERLFDQRVSGASGMVEPFVSAADATVLSDKALDPYDVAERHLSMRPPIRKDADPQVQHEGGLSLRILRAADDQMDHPLVNHVAVFRGAHMVVKYYRPRGLTVETSGFFAVLHAGLAHGDSDGDEAIEAFLRAAEPPAHDDWIGTTNNLRSRFYSGSGARLHELWQGIDNHIAEACRRQPPNGEPGPALLAKRFPLGSGAGATTVGRRFTTSLESSTPSPPNWTVVAKVQRRSGTKPWSIRGKLLLDAESGPGQVLTIAGLVAEGLPASSATMTPEEIEVSVPAGVSEVVLHIVGHTTGIESAVMRRARLRANITAKEVV